MATDNSPPRVRAIAITALIAFLILFGLKFVFDSYYLSMFEAEEYEKIGSVQSQDLIALRAAEKRNLTTAAIPIDQAMSIVAVSREGASARMTDGGIIPEQSHDTNALIGWQKLPHVLTPAEKAEADPDGGAAGGAAPTMMAAGDGGATALTTADGGSAALASDGGSAAPTAGGLMDASAAPKSSGARDAGSSPHP